MVADASVQRIVFGSFFISFKRKFPVFKETVPTKASTFDLFKFSIFVFSFKRFKSGFVLYKEPFQSDAT